MENINKKEYDLSENSLIIYKIFKENPYDDFDINEIVEFIDKRNIKISRRTIYRIINNLISKGKIYCSDINKGTRSFKLSNSNNCDIICKKCGNIETIEIHKKYVFNELFILNKKFSIVGGHMKFYGLCNKCLEKNSNNNIDN